MDIPELNSRGLEVFQALVEYKQAQKKLCVLLNPNYAPGEFDAHLTELYAERKAKELIADSLVPSSK